MASPIESARFVAHGVAVVVSSTEADVVAAFDDVLADMIGPAPEPAEPILRITVEPTAGDDPTGAWYRVTADVAVLYTTLLEGSVVSHVLMHLNARAAIACRAAGAVPVHGGTAGGPDGAILLPGASHSGKTTLTAALAVDGHRFVADEVSRLDPVTLTVAPYGKPVALRSASVDVLAPAVERLCRPGSRFETDERFVPPSDLGPSAWPTAPDPATVTAIVFPRFDPEAAHRFTPVVPAEALERLMQHTLGIPSEPVTAATFRTLERLVRHAAAHDLVYCDLDRALADLSQCC